MYNRYNKIYILDQSYDFVGICSIKGYLSNNQNKNKNSILERIEGDRKTKEKWDGVFRENHLKTLKVSLTRTLNHEVYSLTLLTFKIIFV